MDSIGSSQTMDVQQLISCLNCQLIEAIPTSIPSIDHYSGMSYRSSSMYIYEGALMKLGCSLPSLGNPPITWTWYCGEEVMTNVTFSSNNLKTYLNFTATWKHHKKICYCRAISRSTTLFYDEASRYRYEIRVYHSPRTRPFIYPLSPTTVESGENITIKCNLTTLGFPQIIMIWICENMVPQYGTSIGTETYVEIKVTARYNGKFCRCRGISSPSSYYAHMYTYDEASDPVEITVLPKREKEPDCISATAFGTTTGILVTIILALFTVLVFQYIRVGGKTIDGKTSENSSQQNPTYVNDIDQTYEVLQANRQRL